MTQIIAVTFPIYAAIAIGYLIVNKGWFAESDMRVLGKYVMNIALPALLFNAVASRDIVDVFHPGYMLAFLLGGVATIAAAWLWFTLSGTDKARRAIAVMGVACPNSGFIGYPGMLLTFPDIAGVILALNMLVENFVLIPICLALMGLAKDHQALSIPRTIAKATWSALRRPMVLGLLLGLAVSLVVVGGSLIGLKLTGNQRRAMQVAFGKLVLHPTIVALMAMLLPLIGLAALPPDMYAALILSAAMPMFGIYTVLAQELDLEGAASVAMLAATSLAFVTVSVLLIWLT